MSDPRDNDDQGQTQSAGGQHRATYAKDKKKGGYLVRVIGPHAARFAGREVPVFVQGNDQPQPEKLKALLWSGVDAGEFNKADAGKPVALYSFEPRPKDKTEEIPF